jgi:pseudouridine kinase
MAVLNEKGRLKFAFDDMRILSELTESYLAYHEDLFEIARLVFLDANLPEPALETAFALAKRFDAPVCADPTSAVLAPRLRPYLDRLRLVAPNATEAGLLLGEPFDPADREAALEAARALVNRGVEIVLITLAEFGLCYATSETNGHIPAIRTRIADPTGAGDALTAAMLYGLLNDIDIDDAARLGVAAASLALRYPGTVDPDLSLQRLYDQLPL